jgi:hypothetical protein
VTTIAPDLVFTGRVGNVTDRVPGASLAADVAIGASVLTFDNVYDFDEDGGSVTLSDGVNTETLAYIALDDDALPDPTLTLSGATAHAYTADGTFGAADPDGVEKTAWIARDDIDDEQVPARVPHRWYDVLPEGIRDPSTGEAVVARFDGTDYVIEDILGQTPAIDGSGIDGSTIPGIPPADTTDGLAPSTSPTPSVVGGIASLFISWVAIANADPVTYEVHVSTSTGFTPGPTTKAAQTGGTLIAIQALPDATPLAYGTTYYVKLIAVDADGSAAAGAQGSGSPRQVVSPDLTDLSVTSAKVAAAAITTGKIAADAVTAAEIAALAVGSAELDALAVTSAKVAANAIIAGKIGADAVTATEIANLAVGTSEIAAGAVTAAKILANTITAGQIAAGTITATEIAALTITATQIAAGTITAAKIATGTITANEIAAATITAAKLVANTITAAQIAAGTITANEIAANTITATQIAANTITAAKILAGTITAAEIAAGTITAAKIAANTITAAQIAAGTITAAQIAAGTITATQIAASTITTNQIAANTIQAADIAALTISAAEIAANAITADKILANAVTADKLEAVIALVSTIVTGTVDAARVEMGLNQDDASDIGIRAYDTLGAATMRVDAQDGSVYIRGRLDFGTMSRLLSNDIIELGKQAITGFQTPAIVQRATAQAYSSSVDIGSIGCVWTSPTTTGRTLILVVTQLNSGGAGTPALPTATGWTQVQSVAQGAGPIMRQTVFKIENAVARGGNQAISLGGGSSNTRYATAQMLEISGADVIDTIATDNSGGATHIVTNATGTLAQTGELLLGFIGTRGDGSGIDGIWDNGFAHVGTAAVQVIVGSPPRLESRVTSSIGQLLDTTTTTISTGAQLDPAGIGAWCAQLISIKPKAAGVAAPAANMLRVYSEDDTAGPILNVQASDGVPYSLLMAPGGEGWRMRLATATVNIPSTATSSSGVITPTIAGLVVGDLCIWIGAIDNSGVQFVFRTEPVVTVAGQVTLRYFNSSAGTVDPASTTHYFLVIERS